MSPEIPPRTLRYRTARLARLGLLGRTRPYRERGSAPHHLWPTRKGEAIAKGEAPPRGGERREPNPLFLAHAAGLSELYVVLKTGLPEGTRLAAFDREAEARETFTTYAREERAIAPDACINVAEADGRKLYGFVELDLGTMSHRQLKAKAAGYGEYVQLEAWRERNPFCPALLFITTSEKRARSFLAAADREIDSARMLVACVGLARDLRRCIVAPEWMIGDGERAVDLLGILRAARRPPVIGGGALQLGRGDDEAQAVGPSTQPAIDSYEAAVADLRQREPLQGQLGKSIGDVAPKGHLVEHRGNLAPQQRRRDELASVIEGGARLLPGPVERQLDRQARVYDQHAQCDSRERRTAAATLGIGSPVRVSPQPAGNAAISGSSTGSSGITIRARAALASSRSSTSRSSFSFAVTVQAYRPIPRKSEERSR
jgi:hypothetical protein